MIEMQHFFTKKQNELELVIKKKEKKENLDKYLFMLINLLNKIIFNANNVNKNLIDMLCNSHFVS